MLFSLLMTTAVQAQETTNATATSSDAIGNIVVNLNTASWGQNSPFNEQCYTSYGGTTHAKAGCVPVAYAIVMRHHGFPAKGTDNVLYNCQASTYVEITDRVYDFGKMPLVYDGNWTEEQINEVAKLMSHIGHAFMVEYGSGSTSVSDPQSTDKLKRYFDYELVYASYQKDHTLDAWTAKLKESLDNNNPVIYASDNAGTGDTRHMFVIDGYTDADYFHFNFGWAGSGNGWFKLDNITPSQGDDYSWKDGSDHYAIFNLKPLRENAGEDNEDKEVEVTVNATASNGGTATVNNNASATVKAGENIILSAIADNDYVFVNWTVNGTEVSKDALFTTTATENVTYTANFASTATTVTIKLYGSGGSKIINGDNYTGKCEVNVGSLVTLEADGSEYGNVFAFFTLNNTYMRGGTVVSNRNPYQFIATENATYYVNFVDFGGLTEEYLTANVFVEMTEGGNAYIQNHVATEFRLGEELTLLAAAYEGYEFTGWTDSNDELVSTMPSYTLVVNGPNTYTANFEPIYTGIDEVKAEEKRIIYDLSGRRIEEITKPGIYIVNGKKSVIR